MAAPPPPVYPTAAPPGPAPSSPEWERLLAHLPVDAEASARAHGALARRRKVGSAGALLRLLLGYALGGWSLRSACAWAALAGLATLSDVALGKRLRGAAAWLEALALALVLDGRPPAAAGPVRLRVIDASRLERPGGGALRLHVGLDLATERLDRLELTDAAAGESLARHRLGPGEVALVDAGLCHRRGLADALDRRADVLARYAWQTLPLADAAGAPLPPERLAGLLAALGPGGTGDWAVVAPRPGGPPLALRLLARRLPPAVAANRRARLRRRARKQGRTPPRTSLRLADWLLLVTSLPRAAWPADALLALYRARWQVELCFKRLKGAWLLGAPPAGGPAAARALALARLVGALLADRAARPLPAGCEAWWADEARPLSRWRWQALLARTLTAVVLGPLGFAALRARLHALRRHLCDPPRRRRHQAADLRAGLLPLREPPAARAA